MLNIKKKYLVEFYWFNLTEHCEKKFYTLLAAFIYGMYVGKHLGYRTYIKKID